MIGDMFSSESEVSGSDPGLSPRSYIICTGVTAKCMDFSVSSAKYYTQLVWGGLFILDVNP